MLTVRSDVLEWGSVPTAPWLQQLDDAHGIRSVLLQLLQVSSFDEQGRSECRVPEEHEAG